MSRREGLLALGLPEPGRATMLRASLILDSLVKGMKPECRPLPQHTAVEDSFAWHWRNTSIFRRQGLSSHRLARELIAPGNPERVFHRGVAGRRGLDMGMGQRPKRSSNFSDGEVCHCSTRLPGAPRRQRSSAPWRACSSASALCANSIAFAWYWRNDFMAWNHGTPVAKVDL